MSALFGSRPGERRQWGIIPPIPPNSETGGGGSYAEVDLGRAEASLQKVAVWACVHLIRTIVEVLPLDVFRGTGADRVSVPVPGFLADLGADGFGLADWCSQAVYSSLLRGNTIGLVTDRNPTSGKPTVIALQHPDAVTVHKDLGSGRTVWRIEGKTIDPARIWHRRVNAVPGQVLGMSPVSMHAVTIGTGIAAMRFGKQWFEQGAHPSGLLVSEQPLGQAAAKTAKTRFMDALRGTREPIVLGQGWKYQQIQINPNESQFLETHKYTGAECCRIFGPALAEVLGYDTGGSLTYSNIEQRSLDLLTYAADPWLVRLERWLSDLLPAPQYVKFNRAALIKTDLLSRYQAHEVALRNRWKVVNQVRDDEDMGPVPWGDEPNFTTYTYNERFTPIPSPVNDGPPETPPPKTAPSETEPKPTPGGPAK